ncbi:MAG: hypothetical protein WC121_10755 [Candidatus Kapaibacterium sp.]
MDVQKHDLATNKSKLGQVELADISDAAKDALGGSELDNAYRTLYVSQDFAVGGAFYDDLGDAITYANTLAYNVLIQIYPGTYTGNYYLDPNVILYFMPETIGVASDKTIPFLNFTAGAKVYGHLNIEYVITSGYAVSLERNCIFEASGCMLGSDAIVINDLGGSAIDIQIRVKELGHVNIIGLVGNAYIESDKFSQLTFAGAYKCSVNCKLFEKNLTVSSGEVYLNTDRYFKETGTIFDILGGVTVANGRVDNYADVTDSGTGDGHIAKIVSGTLKLHDFFAKNGGGGVIWGGALGVLVIANSVLQAVVGGGGGSSDTVSGLVGFTVRYSGNTGINTATAGGITEQVITNKILDAAITI